MKKVNREQVKNKRKSNKRLFNEKCDNSLVDDPSKSQNSLETTFINSKKSKKSKLPDPSTCKIINSVSDNNIVNDYSIGDIVWAKANKYPIWPGIVIKDPESNIYYKSNLLICTFLIYFNK